ncbi:MAG: flavodoxin domain-containing protein [Protaetiibacter sp.]
MEASYRPQALVVYESMFGATRLAADAIREGLAEAADVTCVSVHALAPSELEACELVVVGAPTHARSLPRTQSRTQASHWFDDRTNGKALEPHALEPGIREWLDDVDLAGRRASAFTTRLDVARILSGSALRAITKRLLRAGATVERRGLEVVVDSDGSPSPDELEQARAWGRLLGEDLRARAH